ncbi:hypothetical protein Tco_1270539 [Tanacetum coccineum]
MANLSGDIQCTGSDTRPPMLDRTDFASWQQRIRLYCQGKENGVNILNSIDEGPFQMGTFRETLAEGNEGALHLGPERPCVYYDLSPKYKERYNADIRATNILLQGLPKDIYSLINHYTDAKDIWDNVKMLLEGSDLTKEDRESQLYDDFKHFCQCKGETIHDYYFVNNMLPEWGRFVIAVKLNRGLRDSNYDQMYAYLKQHEAHANKNKMMLDRFTQHIVDPLALISNVAPQQYNSQSSTNPPSTYVQPHFADNTQLDSGLSPTDNLIENLTNTLALLTQSYMLCIRNKLKLRIGRLKGIQSYQGFEGLRLSSFARVLGFIKESMEYKIKKRVWFEVELQRVQGDREAEVFQVSNDDTAVAQRRLEDKQPEEKTNTDCLVKEQEKVHLGIKVGANITVIGVPELEGAEGNVAEKKKGVYES